MARIVVIGSVGLDEVIHLRTALRADAHLEGRRAAPRLGGGGANVAVPLARAGHLVQIVAPVGDDAASDQVVAALEAVGVDIGAVVRVPGGPTDAVVLVDPTGERTVVNVHRALEPQPPSRVLDLPADGVLVRDRSRDLAPVLEALCERRLVVAHVPPADPGDRPAHVLVGSRADLGDAFERAPWEAGRRIAGERLEWMVVTRGADGAVAYGREGVVTVPAPPATPVDVTGAGDAFLAGLMHALLSGHRMPTALAVACAWGTEATLWPTSVLPEEAVRRLVAASAVR